MDDYNLRGVVEQFGAATFERMPVQPDRYAHFLITKYSSSYMANYFITALKLFAGRVSTRAPVGLLPKEEIVLPNGTMHFFLMTAITDEELQFGMKNRALDLFYRLQAAGKAYLSDLNRPSVRSGRVLGVTIFTMLSDTHFLLPTDWPGSR